MKPLAHLSDARRTAAESVEDGRTRGFEVRRRSGGGICGHVSFTATRFLLFKHHALYAPSQCHRERCHCPQLSLSSPSRPSRPPPASGNHLHHGLRGWCACVSFPERHVVDIVPHGAFSNWLLSRSSMRLSVLQVFSQPHSSFLFMAE